MKLTYYPEPTPRACAICFATVVMFGYDRRVGKQDGLPRCMDHVDEPLPAEHRWRHEDPEEGVDFVTYALVEYNALIRTSPLGDFIINEEWVQFVAREDRSREQKKSAALDAFHAKNGRNAPGRFIRIAGTDEGARAPRLVEKKRFEFTDHEVEFDEQGWRHERLGPFAPNGPSEAQVTLTRFMENEAHVVHAPSARTPEG